MQPATEQTLSDVQKSEDRAVSRQLDILAQLEPNVRQLMSAHEQKRELWFPGDLLPSTQTVSDVECLQQRAAQIPDVFRVALAVNLLTEEGLPHFHRLIATCLGEDNFWQDWNNLWTAEEDRHGNVLRDYCRLTAIVNLSKLERLQFAYLRNGFRARVRRSPYTMFVYTTLQERATQIAHMRTADAVRPFEPMLSSILRRISSEEARHFAFYRHIFGEIIRMDTGPALEAAAQALQSFAMPGRSIPGFSDMTEVVSSAGIYGLKDYVTLLTEQISFWRIESLSNLDDNGKRNRDLILGLPHKYARLLDAITDAAGAKCYSFDFLDHRELSCGVNAIARGA